MIVPIRSRVIFKNADGMDLFRCVLASLYEALPDRPTVRPLDIPLVLLSSNTVKNGFLQRGGRRDEEEGVKRIKEQRGE